MLQKDRNTRGGELRFYENQDLNCKVLNKYPMHQKFEILVLELKFSEFNWLIIGSYKPRSLNDSTFTLEIRNNLTFYCSSHGNILLVGDFYMTPKNLKGN